MSLEMTSSLGETTPAERSLQSAMWRGAKGKCPSCGDGALFKSYLKVADTCPSCSEELHHQRADDAPPYFTMLIVCHIIGAGILAVEDAWAPQTWVHIMIWIPLTLLMSLALLPPIKGTLIGLQWANRMHGFGLSEDEAENTEAAKVPAQS
ncbi:MAG: DUF983 domain-containing protein [Pseudomonadota bacterium]